MDGLCGGWEGGRAAFKSVFGVTAGTADLQVCERSLWTHLPFSDVNCDLDKGLSNMLIQTCVCSSATNTNNYGMSAWNQTHAAHMG